MGIVHVYHSASLKAGVDLDFSLLKGRGRPRFQPT